MIDIKVDLTSEEFALFVKYVTEKKITLQQLFIEASNEKLQKQGYELSFYEKKDLKCKADSEAKVATKQAEKQYALEPNVVILSLEKYNSMLKIINNAEYLEDMGK